MFLAGEKFNQLTVVGVSHFELKQPPNQIYARRIFYYHCKCDCGNLCTVRAGYIKSGHTKSCGCLKVEAGRKLGALQAGLKHGHARDSGPSLTYNSWSAMHARCYRTSQDNYSRYGGKGCYVEESWHSFENFLADMGARPPGTTLDRIDNDLLRYGPGLCRWTNVQVQQNNRKISNRETCFK